MLFQLKAKCGNHIGPPDEKGNRITYKAGNKVISDDDLAKKWPNKFVMISASDDGAPVSIAPEIPVPASVPIPKETPKSQPPKIKTPEVSKHGVDVTKDFPTATKAELLVFEKSKWFTIVDPDDDEVLNEKKLRRNKVEAFIEDYLPDKKDEEDEEDNTDDEEEETNNEEDDDEE